MTRSSKIEFGELKNIKIRESGRSADYIAPSFGFGCLYNCTYCYMKRHKPEGLKIFKNTQTILGVISSHAYFDTLDKPNQTDANYVTYDISCNEDFGRHAKHHLWKGIFEFFREHPRAKATFATKTTPFEFLKFNPRKKVRIRFSLMPQQISDDLEPGTDKILDRIKAVDHFIRAGYEVHLNYSPVVVYKGWEDDYRELFELVDTHITHKEEVLSEVIFLTHNEEKHRYNLSKNLSGETLLWVPPLQEQKQSKLGGINLRYKWDKKKNFIKTFKEIHNEVIPWNRIRYIF